MFNIIKKQDVSENAVCIDIMPAMAEGLAGDLKKDPSKIFIDADWHGFALIQTSSDKYQLRLYDEQTWNGEWCNIHNRVYGGLLASGARKVFDVFGKTIIMPENVANEIFRQMKFQYHVDSVIQWLDERQSWDPNFFDEYGTSFDEVFENRPLLERFANRYEDREETSQAQDDVMEACIRYVMEEEGV